MSLPFLAAIPAIAGFPRVSGDEPQSADVLIARHSFSPRERG